MTNPAANLQPYTDQYTPKKASIDNSVFNWPSPSNRNLAFVSSSRAAVLNFSSVAMTTPTGPRRLTHAGGGAFGWRRLRAECRVVCAHFLP